MTSKKYLIFFNYPWLKFGIRWPNNWPFPSPRAWRIINNIFFFLLGWGIARLVWILLT